MNPLPFFPPPSRALSRLNDKPPPPSSLGRTSTNTGKGQSSARGGGSLRPGPSNSTNNSNSSNDTNSGSSSPTGTGNHSERSQPRKRAASGPSANPDGSRSPLSGESPWTELTSTKSSNTRPSSSGTSTPTATGGRLGARLPPGLFFDLLRPGETSAAFKMEVGGYSQEDAASLDTLRYRQKVAPHLFLGAFLAMAPPKVSGPLTMAGPSQRKLIGYICGTAASALTARSMKVHSDDEHSWLVCVHSVCVAPDYQRKGLALKLIEEFVRRLRKAEQGNGGPTQPKKGYECVALLTHEELVPLYRKAGFKMLGVSHVNWGTGGWMEMRRYISPKEGDDEEGECKRESMATVSAPQSPPAPLCDASQVATPALASPLRSDPLETGNGKDSYFVSPDLIATSGAPSPRISPTLDKGDESGEMLGGPGGITSSQVLEALKKQASSPGTPDEGPRNPGLAYATIMGQTLAAKTSVEDAFFALEARLVDRESGTNLGEIYCPREECACLLLKVKEADWEVAELGPLASANLTLPGSPAPPSAPVPPPPSSLDRIRSALGSRSGKATTPVRAFWTVYSPMAFENIGFSKDDDWVPPPSVSSPRLNPDEGEKGEGSGTGRKKPTKRGSLFRGPSERKREVREKLAQMEREAASSAAAGAGAGDSTGPGSVEPVKVKYLLCADCDCGPLGYTVLPTSLQGGKFAQEVGKTLEGQGGEASQQEPPVYLIAADRVRYRFVKN